MSSLGTEQVLFSQYMRNTLRATLESLQPFLINEAGVFPPPLSADVKARSLHTLTYVFKVTGVNANEIWPETRQLLVSLAPEMEKAGHRFDWLPYLQKGVELAEIVNDVATQIELANASGYIYQLSGEYEDANKYFLFALGNARRAQDKRYLTRALNCLAYVAVLQRRFDAAFTLIAEAKSVVSNDDHNEIAHLEYILGAIEFEHQNYPKAIQHFGEALQIRINQGDKRRVARVYLRLGMAHHAAQEIDAAIRYTKYADAIFTEINDVVESAAANLNIGALFLCQHAYEQAEYCFQQAQPALVSVQDKLNLATLYHNLGFLFAKQNRWLASIDAYNQSINLWYELDDLEGLVDSLIDLGTLYGEMEKVDQAVRYLQQAQRIILTAEDQTLCQKHSETISEKLFALQKIWV